MIFLGLISAVVFVVSVKGARSSSLQHSMWEGSRQSRLQAGHLPSEAEFGKAMSAVFWIIAGTSGFIAVLAAIRIAIDLR